MLRTLWQRVYRLYAIRKNVRHGRGLHLGLGTIVDASRGLTIGDDVYIGKGCTIEVDGRIGGGVLIANRVGLVGRNDHDKRAVGVTIRRAPWSWRGPQLARTCWTLPPVPACWRWSWRRAWPG